MSRSNLGQVTQGEQRDKNTFLAEVDVTVIEGPKNSFRSDTLPVNTPIIGCQLSARWSGCFLQDRVYARAHQQLEGAKC
jgi:hypothetical protein